MEKGSQGGNLSPGGSVKNFGNSAQKKIPSRRGRGLRISGSWVILEFGVGSMEENPGKMGIPKFLEKSNSCLGPSQAELDLPSPMISHP